MAEFTSGRLRTLCSVSKKACDHLTPMIVSFYNAINGETAKLKADASVFTIADGIVQHLLKNHLFAGGKFAGIVGEEDESNINISTLPYNVEDMKVPEEFVATINTVRDAITNLSSEIDANAYRNLTVFIDPIDGTREFSTGLGVQCSVCIGFADETGKPVAGIVYRPITQPPTYGSGAVSENYIDDQLDVATVPNPRGLLTSNGAISTFIKDLIEKLNFERVPSGGAGNKMLMLLEGKGAAYIQDRGVSRWGKACCLRMQLIPSDTCAAQAVIEAHGGILTKLTRFIDSKSLESYKYVESAVNSDFEEGAAFLTPYNVTDKSLVKKGDPPRRGALHEFKPYSNICGLLALNATGVQTLDHIHATIEQVKAVSEPSYD